MIRVTTGAERSANATATMQGLVAVLLWAGLAALTALAGPVPPFQLAAMTFAVGTLVGIVYARATGQRLAELRQVPPVAWALGVYGLLAFHVCYFFAIQTVPPVEASLIIYTWPLLIVVFSGLLPKADGGGTLSVRHLAGAALGFAGAALIVMQSAPSSLTAHGASAGYVAAVAAAVIWASYSVMSRLLARVPSTAVIGACAATAVASAGLHLLLERTVWPVSAGAWVAVAGLGLGPVGLAFYVWDVGMKRGDVRLLGVAAYVTPLISTLILAALELGKVTALLWLSAALITGGALLAASASLFDTGVQKR